MGAVRRVRKEGGGVRTRRLEPVLCRPIFKDKRLRDGDKFFWDLACMLKERAAERLLSRCESDEGQLTLTLNLDMRIPAVIEDKG